MTLGEKLLEQRKKAGYTQEQLAELLGVSRQAISKWESDVTFPETEKLIRIGKLYNCSLDYLLKEEIETEKSEQVCPALWLKRFHFERKSKRMSGGLPLWHVNLGIGQTAKGIIAVGLISKGVISIGMLSFGIFSFGMLALGLLSIGIFALGLVSAGCIAVGLIALGAICFGMVAIGAVAIGEFSVGALAVGHYAALGDNAHAAVAIGKSEAVGSVFEKIGRLTPEEQRTAEDWLNKLVPSALGWAKAVFCFFF